MRFHVGMMTQNELLDLRANVEKLLNSPHIATITIVDGGSIDGTIPFMRNWQMREPRLRYFIHQWPDNFPEQRNRYLAHVADVANEGDWLITHDPDEFLSTDVLERLPALANQAETSGTTRLGLRCISVTTRGGVSEHRNLDDYWKGLLVRWSPALQFTHNGEGAVHEVLLHAGAMVPLPFEKDGAHFFYEHRKEADVIWWRGVRNYFIGGGGPNLGSKNPRWVELRALTDKLGITTWHEMLSYLVAGAIDQRLREWIIRYHTQTGWDGASEQREWYKLYFRMLHPEEEQADLVGKHIE